MSACFGAGPCLSGQESTWNERGQTTGNTRASSHPKHARVFRRAWEPPLSERKPVKNSHFLNVSTQPCHKRRWRRRLSKPTTKTQGRLRASVGPNMFTQTRTSAAASTCSVCTDIVSVRLETSNRRVCHPRVLVAGKLKRPAVIKHATSSGGTREAAYNYLPVYKQTEVVFY